MQDDDDERNVGKMGEAARLFDDVGSEQPWGYGAEDNVAVCVEKRVGGRMSRRKKGKWLAAKNAPSRLQVVGRVGDGKRDPGSLSLFSLSLLSPPPHSLREQRKEPPPPFRSWKLSDLAIHDLLLLTSLER